MKASNIKGALLEFLVRRLLSNCGFISVAPDNLYTYVSGGCFFINGRGAAHDADVLMEPPIQMPFAYPTRILFECKAYESKATLPIVRNALGLKYDINEFEVVTKDSLLGRKNNRRSHYAIEQRSRYNYQVGVASAGGFSKPAIEFAANNKIPLLSLMWFLDQSTIDAFHAIDQQYIDSINRRLLSGLYHYLKDRNLKDDSGNQTVQTFIRNDVKIGKIISYFRRVQDLLYIGLLESGDLIFLMAQTKYAIDRLQAYGTFTGLKAQIHYSRERPELWYLSISTGFTGEDAANFLFYVPPTIMSLWKDYSLNISKAVEIKAEFFSRIFIFNKGIRPDLPFFVVNIDRSWLDQVSQAESDLSNMESE